MYPESRLPLQQPQLLLGVRQFRSCLMLNSCWMSSTKGKHFWFTIVLEHTVSSSIWILSTLLPKPFLRSSEPANSLSSKQNNTSFSRHLLDACPCFFAMVAQDLSLIPDAFFLGHDLPTLLKYALSVRKTHIWMLCEIVLVSADLNPACSLYQSGALSCLFILISQFSRRYTYLRLLLYHPQSLLCGY